MSDRTAPTWNEVLGLRKQVKFWREEFNKQAAAIAAQAAEIEGLRAKLAQSEEDGESLAAALINAARESVNAKIDSGEIRLPEEPN